ncbi:helix-turn-helix domain-containing protein [Streptomyces iranensis]|uniref:Helix-turn-helix domain protein n=1 Tax=Streptomyces iranensis TaxID=576784 RepID=A0A061A428_9ACTN|nr:helix-turn-helix transcriptional regulator [Streptomyces iranensis]MBP2067542.1 transcriptional regulator with XRE-family HTH domain [Streptomyces iranensis]CDR17585.1 helix-turn-helix domain protein [Streptomyces iranensis]
MTNIDRVLTAIGPRLRALRLQRGITLAALSQTTGISESTLSRLESGGRKANLELLLPLAHVYQVPLDELVGAPETGDPRVHLRPVTRDGMTYVPLSRRPGGLHAHKLVISPSGGEPEPNIHEGYEWIYVLDGRLRLLLGERSLLLTPGEVAEFDTHVPHWLGADDDQPVELLVIFGKQGERAHLRARPT